ncbi:MAG: hypothetical protein KF861_14995 [Planctomycetaceae bacterium]|nr:hypothetical protein [Planctomycetaceae bacterium]
MWGAVTIAGLLLLTIFAHEAGPAGSPPPTWRNGTELPNASRRFTLLMFVHPRCSCTRASLEQLARIQARHPERLQIHLIIYAPEHSTVDWTRTHQWDMAHRIPGAAVSLDPLGTTARRYGAETSGHVVLYDKGGRFCFAGGLTAGRGHDGDSQGADAVLAHLQGQKRAPARTPVFGCLLHARVPRDADCVESCALEVSAGDPP